MTYVFKEDIELAYHKALKALTRYSLIYRRKNLWEVLSKSGQAKRGLRCGRNRLLICGQMVQPHNTQRLTTPVSSVRKSLCSKDLQHVLPRGIEPDGASADLSITYENSEPAQYLNRTLFLNSEPKNKDLRQIEFIAEHWQALPKEVKRSILAIVKANRKRKVSL